MVSEILIYGNYPRHLSTLAAAKSGKFSKLSLHVRNIFIINIHIPSLTVVSQIAGVRNSSFMCI